MHGVDDVDPQSTSRFDGVETLLPFSLHRNLTSLSV
jgi:hypothetical protein